MTMMKQDHSGFHHDDSESESESNVQWPVIRLDSGRWGKENWSAEMPVTLGRGTVSKPPCDVTYRTAGHEVKTHLGWLTWQSCGKVKGLEGKAVSVRTKML